MSSHPRAVTVPFVAPANMKASFLVGPMLPWQVPDRWAIRGKPADSPKEIVSIISEWPTPYWTSFGTQVSRSDHERLHIERCCTDYLLATGSPLYNTLARGTDPPDFIAT